MLLPPLPGGFAMRVAAFSRRAWAVGLFLAVASSDNTPRAAAQQVLRATTRMVVVNVVVTDKKGVPVRDLRREDFALRDGGKEEQIATLSVQDRQLKSFAAPPLPPNVFSNQVGRHGGIPTSVTAILLDGVETNFTDQAYARQQFIKLLGQLQPHDRVALFALGEHLRVIQDFTDDPAILLEAVRQTRSKLPSADLLMPAEASKTQSPPPSPAVMATVGRLNTGLLDAVVAGSASFGLLSLEDVLLPALEGIGYHLSGLPGRKSIVWVTGWVPPIHGYSSLEMQRIWHTIEILNHNDVALYVIDARGLFTDPNFNAENRVISGGNGALVGLNAMTSTILDMNVWASQTGGRAFANTNDLAGAMRKALDESEVVYTLGYYPTHGKWNGEFRPIKVSVDRKGVDLGYRQGYFAGAEVTKGPMEREDFLRAAAHSPLDATGIPVSVRVETPSARRKLKFTISIDASGLTFLPSNGTKKLHFDVWAGQYSKEGESYGGTVRALSADLRESNFQRIQRAGGVTLTMEEPLNNGTEELRVVVRDLESGAIGSVRVPLKSPL